MKLHRTQSFIAAGMLSIASLALVACSSPSPEAAAETPQQQAPPSEQTEARGPMGVNGKIAVVGDGLLQVQDSESQTAVSYTDATMITQEVEGSLSDVSEGDCITSMGGGDDSAAVTTVQITLPTDGECSLGMGGGMRGELPEGFTPPADGERPEGMPEPPEGMELPEGMERPEGMPEGGFGGFTSGKVTAVSGSTITVESMSMDGESTVQEVTVSDETTFTMTEETSSKALAVGKCVVAIGEYDGDQYAAVSLALSEAGEDGCNAGFGGGFPGRGGNGGPGDNTGNGDNDA